MDVQFRNFMPTLSYSGNPITINVCRLSPQLIGTLHEIRVHDEQTLLVAGEKRLALRFREPRPLVVKLDPQEVGGLRGRHFFPTVGLA